MALNDPIIYSFDSAVNRIAEIWLKQIIERRVKELSEWVKRRRRRAFELRFMTDGSFALVGRQSGAARLQSAKAYMPVLVIGAADIKLTLSHPNSGALEVNQMMLPALNGLRRTIRAGIASGAFPAFYCYLNLSELRTTRLFYRGEGREIPEYILFLENVKRAAKAEITSGRARP
jgi:hypothetical protein